MRRDPCQIKPRRRCLGMVALNLAAQEGCDAAKVAASPIRDPQAAPGLACKINPSGSAQRRGFARAEHALLGKLRYPTLVVTERITQDLLRVFAQQWSSHRINRAGQAHGNRRLDVRDPLCRTMW